MKIVQLHAPIRHCICDCPGKNQLLVSKDDFHCFFGILFSETFKSSRNHSKVPKFTMISIFNLGTSGWRLLNFKASENQILENSENRHFDTESWFSPAQSHICMIINCTLQNVVWPSPWPFWLLGSPPLIKECVWNCFHLIIIFFPKRIYYFV